jgi:hypothetical protein
MCLLRPLQPGREQALGSGAGSSKQQCGDAMPRAWLRGHRSVRGLGAARSLLFSRRLGPRHCNATDGAVHACSDPANARCRVGRVAAAPELAATRRLLREGKRQPLTKDCDVRPRDCVPMHGRVRDCSKVDGSANGYDCRRARARGRRRLRRDDWFRGDAIVRRQPPRRLLFFSRQKAARYRNGDGAQPRGWALLAADRVASKRTGARSARKR